LQGEEAEKPGIKEAKKHDKHQMLAWKEIRLRIRKYELTRRGERKGERVEGVATSVWASAEK